MVAFVLPAIFSDECVGKEEDGVEQDYDCDGEIGGRVERKFYPYISS
jgi:hypothetical protein